MALWTSHPARWTAAGASPPPRTSAIGYTHRPACSTRRRHLDSPPALSETVRWLPAGGTCRDRALRAANAPAGVWDLVPPPFLHIPRQRAQNPAAAASAP